MDVQSIMYQPEVEPTVPVAVASAAAPHWPEAEHPAVTAVAPSPFRRRYSLMPVIRIRLSAPATVRMEGNATRER